MSGEFAASQRITGLDAFRGLCLIGVFASHFYFDLTLFYQIPSPPPFFQILFQYGGILFVVLSGICSHLGTKAVKRGAVVFACGMVITAVSYVVGRIMGDTSIVIRFGILHLLGICMLLSPLLKKLEPRVLLPLGLIIVCVGFLMEDMTVDTAWLFPLGLHTAQFSSGDYWPIFPQLGFFMIGIYFGKRFYPERKPLLPKLQNKLPVLCYIGRHSLFLYLLQQPVTFALILFVDSLFLHTISF